MKDVIPPPKRMEWMDLLRGLAILLIIEWHALSIPMLYEEFSGQLDFLVRINYSLSAFRIPTLLIISGFLLESSLKKGFLRYAEGKIKNIVYPYILWSVLSLIALGGTWESLLSIWTWLGGIGLLWYLPVLIFCYIVALIKIPRWMTWLPWWIFPVMFLAVILLKDISTNSLYRMLWYGSFFFIGTILSKHKEFIINSLPIWFIALSSVYTLCVVVYYFMHEISSRGPIIGIFNSTIGAILAIWVSVRIKDGKVVGFIKEVGRNSIVYYVTHGVIMFSLTRIFIAVGMHQHLLVFFILFMVTLPLCVFLQKIRRYTPWLYAAPFSLTTRNSSS